MLARAPTLPGFLFAFSRVVFGALPEPAGPSVRMTLSLQPSRVSAWHPDCENNWALFEWMILHCYEDTEIQLLDKLNVFPYFVSFTVMKETMFAKELTQSRYICELPISYFPKTITLWKVSWKNTSTLIRFYSGNGLQGKWWLWKKELLYNKLQSEWAETLNPVYG